MLGLNNLVQTYSDLDTSADGVKEIDFLRLLPFGDSQDPKPGDRLVLVMVESRLLDPQANSAYTTDDLLGRLRQYKYDLDAEGYHGYCIEARIYRGPMHQDGRSLLAMREFFKAVKADYPSFEGVVLVGAFPEATTFGTYFQIKENDDIRDLQGKLLFEHVPKFYNIGIGWHTRTDIVLADLTGNWDTLYRVGPQTVSIYAVIPADAPDSVAEQTVQTPAGPRTLIQVRAAPHAYAKLDVPVQDVFWIDDAEYSVVDANPDAFKMAFVKEDKNPEVSAADRGCANPIARPDIFVSRINPYHIALNPDPNLKGINGAGFLGPDGKPQVVETASRVVFDVDSFWQRDPAFERALLVDYLDRNHFYRRGYDDQFPHRFATIQRDIYHNVFNEFFKIEDGAAGPFHRPIVLTNDTGGGAPAGIRTNATTLDFVHWLKEPAFLRCIDAHSGAGGSTFGDEYKPDDLAEACGGRPWSWQEEHLGPSHYRYTPSFADQRCAVDYRLMRTLYENRVLQGRGASLYFHTGCEVNTAVNALTDPYVSSRYATFQLGEAILFFLNGLGLIARAFGFYDFPRDVGTTLKRDDARFGDCWRSYFEIEAADRNCRDRKKAYMWSVLGDWTLKKNADAEAIDEFHGNWENFRLVPLNAAHRVALRSTRRKQFVCAESAGSGQLVANRDALGPWETFELINLGNQRCALRSVTNGRYVSVVGGSILKAAAARVGKTETFHRERLGMGEAFFLRAEGGQFVSTGQDGRLYLSQQGEPFQMLLLGLSGTVAFRAAASGRYLCAEAAGAQALVDNREAIGPWESFELVDLTDGRFALKSLANNQYVCAQNAGSGPLIANRSAIGPWESFEFIDLGNHQQVGIIAIANNQLVRARNGQVAASATNFGIDTRFQVISLAANRRAALRSAATQRYLSVGGGGGPLQANLASNVGPAQEFDITQLGGGKVALKAIATGKYVCAENGGTGALIANRDRIGPWETFTLEDQGFGSAAFVSAANGKYVSVGAAGVFASASAIGPNEKFEIEETYLHETVAIKAARTGTYVCAENAGSGPAIANRDRIGPWESFQVVRLGHDRMALRAVNGKYLHAEAGGASIACSGTGIGKDETFEVVDLLDGNVALRCLGTKSFLRVGDDASGKLAANGGAIGSAEFFQLTRLDLCGIVAIRALANGRIVTVEQSGAGANLLRAGGAEIGVQEIFELINFDNGKYALRAKANERFVSAENAGNGPLTANRTAIGDWENFEAIDLGFDRLALKANANQRYVCAEHGGEGQLVASRSKIEF